MGKLDGCGNRFAFQLKRVAAMVDAFDLKTASGDIADTVTEAVIIMVAAYLDEYLRCMVSQAALHDPKSGETLLSKEARDALPVGDPLKAQVYVMQKAKAMVTFKDGAAKLDRAFVTLFGTSVWPDTDTGRLVRDLVRVRNIYVHDGGWPEARHLVDVETKGLIVLHNKFFHKLNVQPFFGSMLSAVVSLAAHANRLAEDHYR